MASVTLLSLRKRIQTTLQAINTILFKFSHRLVVPLWCGFWRGCKFFWSGELGNINIASSTIIAPKAILSARYNGKISIGSGGQIHNGAQIIAHKGVITMGDRVTVNAYCTLYGHGNLTIGNNVLIASHCTLIPANHNFENTDIPIRDQGETMDGITIEDDVWLGTHVTVLDGVTIGTGSVVAAGSVVTKDVEAYSVMAGVPAKCIKKRK